MYLQLYINELKKRIQYILLCFVITNILFLSYMDSLFIFFLNPLYFIQNQELNQYICLDLFNIELIEYTNIQYEQDNFKLLFDFYPVFEINLPFIGTNLIYLKYFIILSIFILFPYITYQFFLFCISSLYITEYLYIRKVLFMLNITILFNSVITYYYLFPIIVKINFHFFNEFLFYEFDVEFSIITYMNIFINLFFFTNILIVFIFCYLFYTKQFNRKYYYFILFIIILIVFPADLITYLLLFIYLIFQSEILVLAIFLIRKN